MRVSRNWKTDRDGRMRGNGCPKVAPAHGYEIISIGAADFCLGCLADAAREKHQTVHLPWFYSGSPHADDLLALGVKPL